MKVVFLDKNTFTYESVPNVHFIRREHTGKYYMWVCYKNTGYTENYKCSRFEVDRIEEE